MTQAAPACSCTMLKFVRGLSGQPISNLVLRLYALNTAKKHLLGTASTQTSVTDIAQTLGFIHMSRTAQDYRVLFGELPSETLAASA